MRASYSSVSLFDKCKAAWKYRYKDRVAEPSSKAAERGSRLHSAAEQYLIGAMPEEQLPVEFWKIKNHMAAMKAERPQVEVELFLDDQWRPCNNKGAAWIVIIDSLIRPPFDSQVAGVCDLKSGKVYDSHQDQLQLYATAVLSSFPAVASASVGALYLDEGRWGNQTTYHRGALPHLQNAWSAKRTWMMQEKLFNPSPSYFNCRFCSFAASKGGPCKDEAQ